MADIDRLFEQMLEMEGSDLHMAEGKPPKCRTHGHLAIMPGHDVLTTDSLRAYLKEITPDRHWRKYIATGDTDFAYSMGAIARFRVNLYKQYYGFGAIFRVIPSDILTLEDLKVPDVLRALCEKTRGLILVTGPTGSGKSTTLAAMIDYINSKYCKHILTIEEPVEFVHENKQSLITQREVGEDSASFSVALKAASREDVDVILVGEMRDKETIALALSAAAMGTLVFGTLHTNSAAKTIDRIVSVFPSDQQAQARGMLAATLTGVCSQLLGRRADGKGRVAINEILLRNSALPRIILEGQISKLNDIIQVGKKEGMVLMDNAIERYLSERIITPKEAYLKAQDKPRFAKYLKNDQV